MNILHDEYGNFLEGNFWILVILFCMGWWNVSAIYWADYNQGIPRTHQGSVIYVAHGYDKWNDYEWTDIEVLTYSGDTHHVYFWGHADFEIGVDYKIHTIRDIRRMRMFPYEMNRKETVVKLEIIDGV